MTNWSSAILKPYATVSDVISRLEQCGLQITLICNDDGILIGTITDGDIRRGLLKGMGLISGIDAIINRNPLVVTPTFPKELIHQLMISNKIRQIPIIDGEKRVVGLWLWDLLNENKQRSNLMIIMAGGQGLRLRPHTEHCPKPMLEIAGKPILEYIIEQAKSEGFVRFVLSINYLGNVIESHFGDGERFGVDITYIREDEPLGTAGSLSLLKAQLDGPIVVANGDIMTDIRFSELLNFHEKYGADATMAVRLHEMQNQFGVVHLKGIDIMRFEEKPIYRNHINAGIYALSPDVLKFLSSNQPCDMPIFFDKLRDSGCRTIAYPMHEPWLDVGNPSSLIEAKRMISPTGSLLSS